MPIDKASIQRKPKETSNKHKKETALLIVLDVSYILSRSGNHSGKE